MDKKELRAMMRERLKNIEDREAQNKAICRKVTDCPFFTQSSRVCIYIGVDYEVDTREIFEYCFDTRKEVYVPKIIGNGEMVPARIHSLDELVPDKFGIPSAPEGAEILPTGKLDMVVVPALAYTEYGKRLGRGGGYYDRFLYDAYSFSIGICYREQILDDIPTEKHDETVSLVFTA